MAWTRFQRLRSLQQGQRSNLGHTMTLHTYTLQPVSLTSINLDSGNKRIKFIIFWAKRSSGNTGCTVVHSGIELQQINTLYHIKNKTAQICKNKKILLTYIL